MHKLSDDEKYILWLTHLEGLGAKKIHALLAAFQTGGAVFQATLGQLRALPEITEANALAIRAAQNQAALTRCQEELAAKGIRFLSCRHPEYPPLLREIYSPPAGLYLLGALPTRPCVSVIGSRRCSEYGTTVAFMLSRDLARRGVAIVSGLARGIDSMAHKGALEAGGETAGVLGCGVDICYPSENRALMAKVAEGGCVVSEYPPGTPPLPGHFPARNRIISGLSRAVVVVEAAEQSGTLITVEQALDQGRDVFAVPGNITSRLSSGTNGLLKQGAALATCAEDILRELGLDNDAADLLKSTENIVLPPEEEAVYRKLRQDPVTLEELLRDVDSDSPTLTYLLTLLELKGHVKRLPGQRYIRI
jgi:DNA processing protein